MNLGFLWRRKNWYRY